MSDRRPPPLPGTPGASTRRPPGVALDAAGARDVLDELNPGASGERPATARRAARASGDAGRALGASDLLGDGAVDWMAMVDLYREEARHAQSPRQTARHLAEVGRIWETHLEDEDNARLAYQEALTVHPEGLGPLRALQRLAEASRDRVELRRLLELELERLGEAPERRSALVRLGRLLQDELHEPETGHTLLAEAYTLAADDREVLVRLELASADDDVHTRLGILDRRVSSVSVPAERARLFREMGHLCEVELESDDEALRYYRSAVEAMPDAIDAIEGITRIHLRHRRWSELVTTLMHAFTSVDDEAKRGRLLYLCALLNATKLRTPERALLFMGQAAMLLTEDGAVLRELVATYEQVGMWGPANALLERLAEIEPPHGAAAAWYRVGLNSEIGLGHEAQAIAAYEKAVEADPHFVPAQCALRRHAWRTGDVVTYVGRTAWLARQPESAAMRAELLEHAAEVLEHTGGNPERALEGWAEALEARMAVGGEIATVPPALLGRVRILNRRKDWAQLADELEHFLERPISGGVRATVEDWLAEIYEAQLGQPRAAVLFNTEVVKVEPENLRALRALMRLFEREGNRQAATEIAERALAAETGLSHRLALLVRIAESHEALGQPDRAEQAWRRALDVDARHLPALAGLGRLLHQHGRWSDLAALHRNELESMPAGAPQRLTALGRLAELSEFRLQQLDDAARIYEEILTLRPDAPDALAGLDRLYGARGRWRELARVLRARAAHTRGHLERATLLFRIGEIEHAHLGNLEEALDLYEAALELWPDLMPAAWALERIAAERGEVQRLTTLYRTLLRRMTGRSRRAVVAHKLAARSPSTDARSLFEQLLEDAPRDNVALWSLAREAAERGDAADLSRRLARLAQLVGERGDALGLWLEAAENAEDAGLDLEDRLALWERVLPLAPEEPRAWEALLGNYSGRERPLELANFYVRLARASDDDRVRSVARWAAGRLHEARGDDAAAAALYREAHASCTDDPVPIALLLYQVDRLGSTEEDRAELLEEMANALHNRVESAVLLVAAGRLWEGRLNDTERGLRCFLEAVRQDATSVTAADRAAELLRAAEDWETLADMHRMRVRRLTGAERLIPMLRELVDIEQEELGDRDAARRTLERLVQHLPDDADVRTRLGDIAFGDESWEAAERHYRKATEHTGDEARLVKLFTRLGQIRARHLGDLHGAIDDLRRAVGYLDPEAHALEELAGIYLRAEDPEAALVAYTQLERVVEDDGRVSLARAGQIRALMACGRWGEAIRRLQALRARDPFDPLLAALERDLLPDSAADMAAQIAEDAANESIESPVIDERARKALEVRDRAEKRRAEEAFEAAFDLGDSLELPFDVPKDAGSASVEVGGEPTPAGQAAPPAVPDVGELGVGEVGAGEVDVGEVDVGEVDVGGDPAEGAGSPARDPLASLPPVPTPATESPLVAATRAAREAESAAASVERLAEAAVFEDFDSLDSLDLEDLEEAGDGIEEEAGWSSEGDLDAPRPTLGYEQALEVEASRPDAAEVFKTQELTGLHRVPGGLIEAPRSEPERGGADGGPDQTLAQMPVLAPSSPEPELEPEATLADSAAAVSDWAAGEQRSGESTESVERGSVDEVRQTMPYGIESLPAPSPPRAESTPEPAPEPLPEPVPHAPAEAGDDVRQTMPYGMSRLDLPIPPPSERTEGPVAPAASESSEIVPLAVGAAGLSSVDAAAGASSGDALRSSERSGDRVALGRVRTVTAQRSPEELVEESRARIGDDPLDAAAWNHLAEAEGRRGRGPVARWVGEVAAWVEGHITPAIERPVPGALPSALRLPLLPPAVPRSLLELMQSAARLLNPVFAGEPSRHGVVVEDAVGPEDPLWSHAAWLATCLGIPEPRVIRNPSRPYTVAVEAVDPPVIVLGSAVVGADGLGLGFLLARCMVPLADGILATRKLSDREFSAFLSAMMELLGAEYPLRARDRATYERLRGQLEPALGGANALRGLASVAAADLQVIPAAALRHGLEAFGARLALALSDSFAGALEMLRRLDFDDRPRSALSHADLQQIVADSEMARDLVVFAASEECAAIRLWRG